MNKVQNKAALAAGSALCAVAVIGTYWTASHKISHGAPKAMVYDSSGYGGFKAAPAVRHGGPKSGTPQLTATQNAIAQYEAGKYSELETSAKDIIAVALRKPTLSHRRDAAEAGSLLAYSAARQYKLALARTRFDAAEKQASLLPDKGARKPMPGEVVPTLQEDAVFQHAVCTGALGHKADAEAEYVAFMKHYPDSPLVQASIKRIARLHGGNVPKADEAVWRTAMGTARNHAVAKARNNSLCGPECLAEILRRRGEPAAVLSLASQMRTSDHGTTMAELADSARRHGMKADGLALTAKGLSEQKLPLIALIRPGHYVIVDKIDNGQVTVWDPEVGGHNHSGIHAYTADQWAEVWHGYALSLSDQNAPNGQQIAQG